MADKQYKGCPDNHCICFNLRKASRVISQFYDQYLRQAGLRGTQYALMAHIDSFEGLSLTELAEILGMEQSTITRNVELLAKKGYITVAVHHLNGRKKSASLTKIGQKKMKEAWPFWKEAQDALQNQLGTKQLESLLKITKNIVEAL